MFPLPITKSMHEPEHHETMDQGVKHTKRKHCLLVFDTFCGHLTEDVTKALRKTNTSTIVVPGGCTSKVQPIDVSLNRPIIDIVRGQWEEYLYRATSVSSTADTPAPT